MAEPREIGARSKTASIDERLRVFDPKPQLKGLRLERESLPGQRAEGIPSTMAEGQDHPVAAELPLRSAQGAHTPRAVRRQRFESRLEMEAHALPFEPRPQARQDAVQPIRPDMSARVIGDLGVRAGLPLLCLLRRSRAPEDPFSAFIPPMSVHLRRPFASTCASTICVHLRSPF